MPPYADNQDGVILDLRCRKGFLFSHHQKKPFLIIKHFNGDKGNDNESLHIIDLNPQWN